MFSVPSTARSFREGIKLSTVWTLTLMIVIEYVYFRFAEAKCEEEAAEEDASSDQGSSTLRRNLFEMLGMNTPRTISIATQTVANNVRRSAATQTEQLNQLDSD